MEGPRLIHHPQLDQLQPPADPGQTGMLRGHGPDAHLPSQRGGADGVDLPAVLVVPRKIGEQLGAPGQSQLCQLFRPGLPHSGELVQGVSNVMAMGAPPFRPVGVLCGSDILPQVYESVKGGAAEGPGDPPGPETLNKRRSRLLEKGLHESFASISHEIVGAACVKCHFRGTRPGNDAF